MLPIQPRTNGVNMGFANAKMRRSSPCRARELTNRPRKFFGHAPTVHAFAASLSTLCNLISHIVGIRPKHHVRGVHTAPDIAFMEDVRPFRDGLAKHLIGRTMGRDRLSLMSEATVTGFVCRPRPKPAPRIRLWRNAVKQLRFKAGSAPDITSCAGGQCLAS